MSKTANNKDLGRVLVTGGSGFVGCNFVTTLLNKGFKVCSFDLAPSPLTHENLDVIVGNICDQDLVNKAVKDVDTVFHTAAIIDLKGGKAVTKEYRDRSYAINVEGTKNLLIAARKAGVSRFVYTASNSVVIGGKPITNGTEAQLPYTERFNDLYTETKVVAEKWVLAQNSIEGLYTCSIRPSGIWGEGDKTMFKQFFDQMIAGLLKARVGMGDAKLDNSYVHNLIHGHILAAEHLYEGGTAPGEAFFINDGDPINMFDFARPVIEAVGENFPRMKVPAPLVKFIMIIWQALHFRFGFPEPPVPPLAVERIAINNYFSIDKARRDLGYEPLYTTAEAMKECLPYYQKLYQEMRTAAGK